MVYPEYQSDIDRTLESELMGEMIFSVAARWTFSRERRKKWLCLRDLETQTKNRILDFLQKTGTNAAQPSLVHLKGGFFGFVLGVLPWGVSMGFLGGGTAPFLKVFERLELHSPEGEKALFSYIVAHEEAIAAFSHHELKGEAGKSLAPIVRLLSS